MSVNASIIASVAWGFVFSNIAFIQLGGTSISGQYEFEVKLAYVLLTVVALVGTVYIMSRMPGGIPRFFSRFLSSSFTFPRPRFPGGPVSNGQVILRVLAILKTPLLILVVPLLLISAVGIQIVAIFMLDTQQQVNFFHILLASLLFGAQLSV